MKTFEENFVEEYNKALKQNNSVKDYENWEDFVYGKHGWDACLKEVSEELRNIIEYKDDGRDTEERLIDFCKKIFEETHNE